MSRFIRQAFGIALGVTASMAAGSDAVADCAVEDSVVFIAVSADYGQGLKPLWKGSGVLIHESGYVLTAAHLLPKDRSNVLELKIEGSVRTKHGHKVPLNEAAAVALVTDITLLRFPPGVRSDWCYRTIGKSQGLKIGDEVFAWGFPVDQDLSRKPSQIDSLDGPKNSMQMGPGVTEGMSGGPVLNDKGELVGVTVGGAQGYPSLNFLMPAHYAKVLLDQAGAHFSPGESIYLDQKFEFSATRDDHHSDISCDIYRASFPAKQNYKIVSCIYNANSANNQSNESCSVSVNAESATFEVKLCSGPFYDRWRGWWGGNIILRQEKLE